MTKDSIKSRLVIVQDTREQRGLGGTQVCLEHDPETGEVCDQRAPIGPCPRCKALSPRVQILATRMFDQRVVVIPGTLATGDYAARGFEKMALLERKGGEDLWNTVHAWHARFDLELSRLGDVQRVAIVVDDAEHPVQIANRRNLGVSARESFYSLLESLEFNGRTPIKWMGSRSAAATYIEERLLQVVDHFDPARLDRCTQIALAAGPYSSIAAHHEAAMAVAYGICCVCGIRPGSRPKPAGPGVCVCGRRRAA